MPASPGSFLLGSTPTSKCVLPLAIRAPLYFCGSFTVDVLEGPTALNYCEMSVLEREHARKQITVKISGQSKECVVSSASYLLNMLEAVPAWSSTSE